MKKTIIVALLIILLLAACSKDDQKAPLQSKDTVQTEHKIDKKEKVNPEYFEKEEEQEEEIIEEEVQEEKEEVVEQEPEQNQTPNKNVTVVSNPNDLHVVVNKQRKLPDGYEPPDLVIPNVLFYSDDWEKKHMRQEAATALELLFAAAANDGIDLIAVSGYRSYERQTTIYNYNVETQGLEHAQRYSAMPGHSEHQTGLTMDVSGAALASSYLLEESFRQTAEGEWLEQHAHEHGFVIRYPKGKEHITGYAYEPWHIRYVGKETAKEIFEKQLTLEEFFGFVN